jgi:hypothetical protein
MEVETLSMDIEVGEALSNPKAEAEHKAEESTEVVALGALISLKKGA